MSMPDESAAAFARKVREDQDLQNRLKAIEADTKEAMLAAVARIASDAGFPLTSDQLTAVVKDESEVTDVQLEGVVGGVTSIASAPLAAPPQPAPESVPGHAYTVLGTYEADGSSYVVVRNPWGTG
jgi:predicted ribosomally synthesized peptide with nif11-like leader